jgi:hypothetical protein
MSERKHSPAPWSITSLGPEMWICQANPSKQSVCDMPSGMLSSVHPGEVMANALLIAAAPEMLAELLKVEWANEHTPNSHCPSCDNIKEYGEGHKDDCTLAAAIARAKGDPTR